MVHPTQQKPSFGSRKPVSCIVLVRKGHLRPIKIQPWVAGLILCAAAMALTAFVGAAGYLLYRDDLLGSTFARQVRMQYEYEDRIAALRSELDRATSRHVIETQGVEQQLATLLNRQDTIERRQTALSALVDKARDSKIELASVLPVPPAKPVTALTTPLQDPAALAYMAAPPKAADIIIGTLIGGSTSDAAGSAKPNMKPILSSLENSIDGAQAYQTEALDALARAAEKEAARLSSALAPVGVAAEPSAAEPQGGPFIAAGKLHFVERAALLDRTLDDIAALRHAAEALPLARPVAGTRMSSRFGYRNDPFLNRPALHAGLDFIAASGAEVRATGSGTIIFAGWQGGYGQMVEVRHANGVSTRYGHLSAVLVGKGQKVSRGALIGRVGSTGRSTGPHLHYETRRRGQPVDPAIYLAAGRAL